MAEKIGLQAIWQDAGFRQGVQQYTKSVDAATQTTDRGAQQITQSTQQVGSAWQTMGTIVGGVVSTYLVKQMAEAAFQLGMLGATAIRQRTAFEELAKQAGGSADEILAAIKRATDGTVANSDIILAANKGILLGLGAQAEQWEKLTEVARFRARAMGLTVTQALNDITTGIGRESRLILDNLGIILDLDEVMGQYASSLGKTTEALTAAERKQAILTSVIEDGQRQIAAAGGIVADYGDQIERMNAALADAKTQLAEAVAPAVADVAGAVANATPKLAETANQLVSLFEAGLAWAEAALTGQDATEAFNDSILASVGAMSQAEQAAQGWMASLGGLLPVQKEATEEAEKYAAVLAGVNVVVGEMTTLTDAQRSRLQQRAKDYHKSLADQQKAQEDALKEMERNESQYASALGQLYDQIVDASQQAAQDRLKADQDYAAAALKLEQDLADERAQILRDLAQADEDARRQADQDREDAARKLARDLEDLQTNLAERNAETWADYYRTIEELAIEHGERLKSITERYASEAEAIAKKYSLEPEPPTADAQREALQAEIRAIKERARLTGALNLGRLQQAEAELEALKQAELAALEERKQAELTAEEAAYQEEQTRLAQRREEQLAANQEQYDKEAEQKRLAYDRELEDLRVAQARETEERQLAAQRQLDDLARQGEAQRAELAAQHQARLAEITAGLAVESQAFRDAYQNELRDLDTYLAQRTKKWQDHKAEIERLLLIRSPSKWMEDIGKQMRAGLDQGFSGPSIATDLQQAVASFGQGAGNYAMPMASGGSTVSNQTNYNSTLSVNATYTRPQSERSLRDDLRLYDTMMRMRGRS